MTVIKIMLTSKRILLPTLLILIFLFCACTDLKGDTSYIPSDTEVSLPEFSSASEAKRALVALTDGDVKKSLYTDEWVQEYRALVSEVNSLVSSPPKDENECISACASLYARLSAHLSKAELVRRDVPAVYIYTDKPIGREEYVDAKVYIIDTAASNRGDTVSDITIRVRGNSTASAEKKPYNIKFTEKTSVLGMPQGRKWCLIANHYDKTLIRNKLASDFAAICGGVPALQNELCDVYLNDKLCGSYLLTQPVSDGSIDLDTKKGDFIVERIIVLEGENDFYLCGDAGYVFDTPERQELSRGEQKEIIDFMKRVDDAIRRGNEDELKKLIDVDSFVSAYLIHELLKDCDMTTGSTYFYRKDGILYAGPIWDMDLSMGNVSRYYFQDKYHIYNNADGFGDKTGDSASGIWAQQEWFSSLMKKDFFYNAVKEKYSSLTDEIKNLYLSGGYIDTLCDTYGASFSRNYNEAGWRIDIPYSDFEDETPRPTFEENIAELKSWLSRRDAYLRDYFGIK
ncbi:MAG: CotH kinase family protein [Clostridia bacterium]|nr:CotH kinase family protein [Clostridia bacterium]